MISTRSNSNQALLGLLLYGVSLLSLPIFAADEQDNSITNKEVKSAGIGRDWILGDPKAQFTITEFADLECPVCKEYFPVLARWIADNPDVNLKWHHFPLNMHNPAASYEAVIVECAGDIAGNSGFWKATEMIYANTRGDGQGLAKTLAIPGVSPLRLAACVSSGKFDSLVKIQARKAIELGIKGTPSLVVTNNSTGSSVTLSGYADENALLSALDLISSP